MEGKYKIKEISEDVYEVNQKNLKICKLYDITKFDLFINQIFSERHLNFSKNATLPSFSKKKERYEIEKSLNNLYEIRQYYIKKDGTQGFLKTGEIYDIEQFNLLIDKLISEKLNNFLKRFPHLKDKM